MAKYEVTHLCGHTDTVNLVGPGDQRQRKLAWLETQPCLECIKTERKLVGEEAYRAQTESGIPALVGTEKQIAWAAEIRQGWMNVTREIESRLEQAVYANGDSSQIAEHMLFELDDINKQTMSENNARWWIDRRDDLTRSMLVSKMSKLRNEIADHLPAVVAKDFPVAETDRAEILKLAIEKKKEQLEDRRRESLRLKEEERAAAAKKESDKQANLWARRDECAQKLAAAIGNGGSVSVYWKDEKEKRIYLNEPFRACLFVTGNGYNRPGSIDVPKGFSGDKEALREALSFVSEKWKNVSIRFSADGKAL